MRIKSWIGSILKSFRIRPSRAKRRLLKKRWLKKKYASRIAAAGLAVAASTSLISSSAIAQCDAPLSFDTGTRPNSVISSDFNGDGIIDLATANIFNDDVSVLLGTGNGTFELEQRFAAGDGPFFVTTGDFNGDGLADLTTADTYSCLLYTSPSPRDATLSRMPSSA